MADVVAPIGILAQIRAVAGLRWRILRNGLRRKSNRFDLLGLIVVGSFSAFFVVSLCFAFFAGAYAFVSEGHPARLGLLFWGIFVFWQLFPILAAGFGASFEFRSLLRFPLNLTAFYIIGLAYGLADYSSIGAVCWLASMILGAAMAKPGLLPAMLFVVALFLLLNVTLERLVGSWLERLLSRRRTREVFLALFVLSMISVNFINPLVTRYGPLLRPIVLRFVPYSYWLPPSLAGRAIAAASDSQASVFVFYSAGLFIYGILLSVFLWLRFAAQFRGEELSETAAPARVVAHPALAAADDPDRLSALSPQVAAVVRKEFRYLTRNGFAFLTLFMPPLLVLFFTFQFGRIHTTPSGLPFSLSADMFFPAMTAYLILILMSPAYNCFAYDGRGILTYFMVPLRFREVLLGKNLLLLSILAVEMGLSLGMLGWRVGLPSLPVLAATVAAIVFAATGQLIVANWSSLAFPRKLEFGRMRGQRQSGMAVLLAFAGQIVFAGISAVVLFSGRWTGNRWLPAEAFTLLAAAAIGGYFSSLDALSRVAEKKKEVLIEALSR